jgi:hypothetical protein
MSIRSSERGEADPFIAWIRTSDPLREAGVAGWSRGPEATAMFRSIVEGDRSSSPSFVERALIRPRRKRPVILALAVLLIGGGVAGANLLLGGPAPESVKQDLADVDRGLPADLRYDPNVEEAHLAAQADGAELYVATLKDGGYCTEIVTPDEGPRGAVCTPAASAGAQPIELSVPFSDPLTEASPIVAGGRVNASRAASLRAEFDDGSLQAVPIGIDGFFVFAVRPDHLAQAHRHGITLIAAGADGQQVASEQVPPTDFTDPEEQDAKQPIFVSTISMQDDLTKVLGVEGSVNVRGAASLELRYPDGTTVDIPLQADGRYRYDLPARRTGDLFERPGALIARDASGKELARAPVAAVAFWRAAH